MSDRGDWIDALGRLMGGLEIVLPSPPLARVKAAPLPQLSPKQKAALRDKASAEAAKSIGHR